MAPANERFQLIADWIRSYIQFNKEDGNTDFGDNNMNNSIKDHYLSQSK